MGSGARQRFIAVWISVLALVAQMLLPVAHAEAMFSRSGDPLAYAICGNGSPEFRRALYDAASRAAGDAVKHAELAKAQCSLCSAHAQHAAGLPDIATLSLVSVSPTSEQASVPAAPFVRQLVLPPLRAPPGLV